MESIKAMHKETLIVYDANEVVSEWTDFITSGYLFIEGKRVVLENQLIMELREINHCSPSFVGKCQISYINRNIIPKV